MKIAIIGSRSITDFDLSEHIPKDTTEIVSGGAMGVDSLARSYAILKGLKLTEFLPDYKRFRKCAPLKRNIHIVEYSDCVLAFWDGKSRGTKHVINLCRERNKPIKVIVLNNKN